MNTTEKDELFDRKNAQGSVYDKMYFTDDQLKQGAEINQKAAAGEVSWESAHNWWENTRAGYGYTGGEDGHGYTKIGSKSKDTSPSYTNRYQSAMDQAANALLNRKAFTYDPANDPTYQQYADSYTRQGKQAMEDTLAQVSARTGGLASSYAGTAAQQTYNGYMSALADKVPELRQLAYQMYMDEGDTMRQNLDLLQGLEATEYGRYRDSVADDQRQQAFDYEKNLAAAQLMGEAGDFSGYQRMYNLSEEKVGNLQDSYAKGDKLTAAQILAQAGDYSGYQDLLGLTDEQVAALSAEHGSNKLLTAAELMAQAGDFSGYKDALNLTDEQVATLETWYQKRNAPKVTGGSGYTPKSSTPDYEGLFAAAQASGYPKSYIANNYKNFGFTSSTGLYDEFSDWDGGAEDGKEPYSPPPGVTNGEYGESYDATMRAVGHSLNVKDPKSALPGIIKWLKENNPSLTTEGWDLIYGYIEQKTGVPVEQW